MYLVVECEWVDTDHSGCEDNIIVWLQPNDVDLDSDGIVIADLKVALPEGWATVVERGGRRLRCSDHAPKKESE